MRYPLISKTFFKQNREKLAGLLPKGSLAVFAAAAKMPRNGDQFYTYRQQSDFFYLTGIEVENACLILYPSCQTPELQEVLFIEAYNLIKATWDGHMLSHQEARDISGVQTIRKDDQFDAVLRELMHSAQAVYLNLNEYPKYQTAISDSNKLLADKIKAAYPLHDFFRAAPLLEGLRVIKSETEIKLIEQACQITGKAFERVLRFVEPGKYEFEVQAEIDHEFTIRRAQGHAYAPIIAGGINSCILHYTDNDSRLESGDLLLFDFGAEYANYASDMSRTIPVNGKFTDRQKDCYRAVLRVLRQATKLYVPGNTTDQINKDTWLMMEEEMIGLGLFTPDEVKNQHPEYPLYQKYLMHGVAHHVGLDVHDPGLKHQPLKPGMVITCEPGIYILEEKIGIRLENDILVTDSDPVSLMAHIPIEADEIEELMQRNY